MLRVYGITYDHTTNYGSCLQAYALQNAIEKIELSDKSFCEYKLIPIEGTKDWKSKPRFSLKAAFVAPMLFQHRRRFVGFEGKYMKYAPIQRIAELPSLNQEADAFVCGSDVIWRPEFNHGYDAFYLDFAKKV